MRGEVDWDFQAPRGRSGLCAASLEYGRYDLITIRPPVTPTPVARLAQAGRIEEALARSAENGRERTSRSRRKVTCSC